MIENVFAAFKVIPRLGYFARVSYFFSKFRIPCAKQLKFNLRRHSPFRHPSRHRGAGWCDPPRDWLLSELELRLKKQRVACHETKSLTAEFKVLGQPVTFEVTSMTQNRPKYDFADNFVSEQQGCGAGAGAGAGAAGADRFWSEPEPEPEPPKRFARSRSRSRSRQKRGGSGSEKGYNCGKKKNESEITRNSRTNSLPKFYINNLRTSATNYLKFSWLTEACILHDLNIKQVFIRLGHATDLKRHLWLIRLRVFKMCWVSAANDHLGAKQ